MNTLMNIYVSKFVSDHVFLSNYIWNPEYECQKTEYSEDILTGIIINRKINEFIEQSPIYKRSKKRLKPCFIKNSSRIIDIFYDHFLASNWEHYNQGSLNGSLKEAYIKIVKNKSLISYKYKKYILRSFSKGYYLKMNTMAGVHNYMLFLAKKDNLPSTVDASIEDLLKDYSGFKSDFDEFILELTKFVSSGSLLANNAKDSNKRTIKYSYTYVR